ASIGAAAGISILADFSGYLTVRTMGGYGHIQMMSMTIRPSKRRPGRAAKNTRTVCGLAMDSLIPLRGTSGAIRKLRMTFGVCNGFNLACQLRDGLTSYTAA